MAALHEAFPVRQCSGRLPKVPVAERVRAGRDGPCLSPCDGSVERRRLRRAWCDRLRDSLLRRPDAVVACVSAPDGPRWPPSERFEEAGVLPRPAGGFLRGAARTQRLRALTRCPELVAARREDDGRWAVHVVRHGRLAAAGVIPSGAHAGDWVARAAGLAPTPWCPARARRRPRPPRSPRRSCAGWSPTACGWSHVDGEWTCPVGGATKHLRRPRRGRAVARRLVPFDDRRSIRTGAPAGPR